MKAKALTAAMLASGLLAACGGADGTEGTGDGGSPSATAENAMLKFARCMRAEGVEMGDPGENGLVTVAPGSGEDGEPANPARFRRAEQRCGRYLREAGPPPQLSKEGGEELERRAIAFARCMREQGIDLPDPDVSISGPGTGGDRGTDQQLPEGADPLSPRFREAERACRHAAPELPGSAEATP